MTRRQTIFLVSVVIFVSIWIPFPTVVVPKWKVRVVDVNESPCVNQTVRQSWAHYSLSDESDGDYLKSDGNGYVEFPTRKIRKNLVQRVVYPVVAYALLIAHGSVGISAYVYASEPVNAGVFGLEYDWSKPLPDKLIIKRCFVDLDIPDKI